jgi:hypothetical protein
MMNQRILLRKWGGATKLTTICHSNPKPIGEIASEFLKQAIQNAESLEQSKQILLEKQENNFIKQIICDCANEISEML